MINRKDEFPYPLDHGRGVIPEEYYFPALEWENIHELELNIKREANNDDDSALSECRFSDKMFE